MQQLHERVKRTRQRLAEALRKHCEARAEQAVLAEDLCALELLHCLGLGSLKQLQTLRRQVENAAWRLRLTETRLLQSQLEHATLQRCLRKARRLEREGLLEAQKRSVEKLARALVAATEVNAEVEALHDLALETGLGEDQPVLAWSELRLHHELGTGSVPARLGLWLDLCRSHGYEL